MLNPWGTPQIPSFPLACRKRPISAANDFLTPFKDNQLSPHPISDDSIVSIPVSVKVAKQYSILKLGACENQQIKSCDNARDISHNFCMSKVLPFLELCVFLEFALRMRTGSTYFFSGRGPSSIEIGESWNLAFHEWVPYWAKYICFDWNDGETGHFTMRFPKQVMAHEWWRGVGEAGICIRLIYRIRAIGIARWKGRCESVCSSANGNNVDHGIEVEFFVCFRISDSGD